ENGGSETPFLTVKTTGETPVPQFCHRLLAVGGVRSRANGRWLVALCLGGLPGVAGLLAYHQATTGDWKHGPYTLYEQQQSYSGQFLHGSPAPPPNLQSMPVNVRRLAEDFTAPAHRRHTFARLPLTIAVRFAALSRDLGFAMLLLPFVAPPAAWSCRAARPLIWVCIGFFAAYLLYAFDYPRYLAPIVAGLVWSMMAGLRSVRQESGSCAPDPNHGLPPRPKCGTARPPAATKVWPGRPARDPTGETPVPQAQEPPTLVGGHAQTGHTATPLPGPGALGPNDEPRCAVESVAQRAGLRPRRANGSKGAKGPYHVLELLLVALIVIGSFWAAHRLASLGLDPPTRRFHNLVASLPPGPKLIFVRYAPDHSFHREYVFNEPDLERAESIFAHDLGGERNVELMKANPDRRAYVYDEAARQMKPCS
ncbi:MAG: hypothetical protein JXQ75_12090, partial [Phycisphaerae bacterium]|nr:hypothetical protein [Phycisphaerae bacterium]